MDTKWGSVGKGWDHLVQPLIDMCEKRGAKIEQIKEKFGTLRFYVDTGDDEIWNKIGEAENKSATICETCGEPGTLKNVRGWIKCVCEDQFLEWVEEARKNQTST